MPFQIIRENIINIKADAIVNSTNPHVMIGSGVDKAIHDAAGPELFIERQKIGEINTGEAYISSAFDLNAKYVIHTVGPDWIDGRHDEDNQLANCYQNSLQLAKDNQCESIAFPLISTGVNGYPRDAALMIALRTIKKFQKTHDIMVYLVVYNKESFVLSNELSDSVNHAIEFDFWESSQIESPTTQDFSFNETLLSRHIFDSSVTDNKKDGRIDDVVYKIDGTFSKKVVKTIMDKALIVKSVFFKANMSQDFFSRIIVQKENPSKSTAIAIAIALELNLDETKALIKRAGYALSKSNEFEIIVELCINRRYDVYTANMILFEYDQVLLGS